MEKSKLKSLLAEQKIKNEFGNKNVSRAINRYYRNLTVMRNCGDAIEKSLMAVVVINICLLIISIIVNRISNDAFTEDLIVSTIKQFTTLLQFLLMAPIAAHVFKNIFSEKEEDRLQGSALVGKAIGTTIVLALTPSVLIITIHLLKMFLI